MRKAILMLHAATMAMISANSDKNALTVSRYKPVYIPSHMMGAFGHSGIIGTGKQRKKKSNKIHDSRMLRKKHARKNR